MRDRGLEGATARAQDNMALKLFFWELEEHLKSSSGIGVVAIDNKIEQAMDLVKSHLMYAVREEVEVLKEQIKELIERNTQLEQENNLLKTLASPEQMAQFQAQVCSRCQAGNTDRNGTEMLECVSWCLSGSSPSNTASHAF